MRRTPLGVAGFEHEEGAIAKGPLETGKGGETDSAPEPPGRNAAPLTP